MINQNIIEELSIDMQLKADVEYAAKMSAYMKGHFTFLGIASPQRKVIFSSWYSKYKAVLLANRIAYALHLWSLEHREYHYLAMLLLSKRLQDYDRSHIVQCRYFITTHSWWDTVDWLASNMLGSILRKDKQLQYEICGKWSSLDHMWLFRSVIIHQLKYRLDTDHELLFALIDSTIGNKEFFINKASGWALRELSKTKPQLVRDFLGNRDGLSNLTVREASKYL